MTGWGSRRGAGGRGRARAAVCLVAAAGLVLGGAAAPNRTVARQGHQPVSLLAATLASDSWTGTVGGWSGYLVNGGASYSVTATFTVPTVYCQSTPDGSTGFWVGIFSAPSNGRATIVQDGIQVGCANGQPSYSAWLVGSGYSAGVPVCVQYPVQPLDTIAVSVWEFGATYYEFLDDTVQNWSWLVPVTGGAASSNIAAVAAESFNGGAAFDPVAVTGAQVNGLPLNQFNLEASEQNPGNYVGTAGLDPSGLDASGQDFNFYWNGPPGPASPMGREAGECGS